MPQNARQSGSRGVGREKLEKGTSSVNDQLAVISKAASRVGSRPKEKFLRCQELTPDSTWRR